MTDTAPYPGPLKLGDHGPAVVAVQGALRAWSAHRLAAHPQEQHLRHILPTGHFLKPTALQVGHFQELHSIPVTNTFGPAVHRSLSRWYTAHDRAILAELHIAARVRAYHQLLFDWMMATAGPTMNVTRRGDWIYTQGPQRMELLANSLDPATARNVHGDCSSTAGALIVLAARQLDLPVPAFGNWFTTYSLISHGVRVSPDHLAVGDRIHYGANSHVGLYMGGGRVWSFGGEPGPCPRNLDYRWIYACRRDIG